MEDPRIRLLLELRKELEEEMDQIRARMERIELYLHTLDSTIGLDSFSTAESAFKSTIKPTPEPTPSVPSGPRKVVLMNKARDLELATLEITDTDIHVTPASHASYDIKRGAFARFFVERILGQFQQEDRRRVENEEIDWQDAFDFEVKADDGTLVEIFVRNYGGDARLDELQKALRWALEKTYRSR